MSMIDKIILSQNGNQEATEEIFTHYHQLILDTIKSYYFKGGDYEDVLQEAYIGFFNAINAYKSEKGVLFSTFARICIQRQVITALRKYNSNRHTLFNLARQNEHCVSDYEHTLLYKHPSFEFNSPEDIFFEKNLINLLKNYLNKNLSEIEKEVYNYTQLGYSYKEIGLFFNTSPKNIDNTLQRIRKKILKYLDTLA